MGSKTKNLNTSYKLCRKTYNNILESVAERDRIKSRNLATSVFRFLAKLNISSRFDAMMICSDNPVYVVLISTV